MIAGGLIVQHDIIRARNAHEVVASSRRKQQQQIIGRILVGLRVVGVTDIATHRQAQQLSHKVIFQPGSNDLSFIVQIFRPDKANDAVYQKRLEYTRNPIRPCFQCELVDAMMGFRRKRASLPRFKVHQIFTHPRHIALAVMFHCLFSSFL